MVQIDNLPHKFDSGRLLNNLNDFGNVTMFFMIKNDTGNLIYVGYDNI